jgi:hypothetical protein
VQNVIGVFIVIALNTYIAFGSMAIFTVLIPSIQDHGRSFNLLYLLQFLSLVVYSFH